MDVRCDKCATEYEFDENRIGANGVTVKCTACGFVFKVKRPRRPPPRATTTIGKGPQGREWLVRKPDGQMIAFRELTTLQKWIVEGRISRDDEISKNGETWKRLGNIMELEPFFSVYEKARTLNTLMDQNERIELRGSEVLAASSPIPQPLPVAQPLRSSPPAHTLPPPPLASEPPHQEPVSLPPPSQINPMPQDTAPMPAAPEPAHNPGNGMPHTFQQPVSAPTQPTPSAPSGPTFPSPAAMSPRSNMPPAAAPRISTDLSFPIRDEDDADGEPSKIVSQFEKGQRRRRFGWMLFVLVLAGAGGGTAMAIYGPEGNPLKALAAEYGLLPKQPVDDGASRLIEDAQAAADLDTIASMQMAVGLLERAETLRTDPTIAAERALILITQAGTYQRWAKDLENTAATDEKNRETYMKQADDKRKLASPLLTEAFQLASNAANLAPDRLEPSRALAAYHLLQGDEAAYTKAIGQAKAGMEKAGRVDPATLYLEAAATLKDPSAPSPEGLDRARSLLEQALTTRPTMNRARVLLARIHMAKGSAEPAKLEIDRVLATAADHEEAKLLTEQIKTLKAPELETPPPPPPPAETVKKEEPTHSFEYWMKKADGLRERDRTKAAMNAYGKAAEINPGSAEPHTGKGWCFLDLERPRLALGAFQKALKRNDRYVIAYYGLAESHRALGDDAKALEAYEEYLSRAPANSPDRRSAERAVKQLKSK